ncbi:hypothetical protein GQ457_11G028360 [Hibiscus cannabinus]
MGNQAAISDLERSVAQPTEKLAAPNHNQESVSDDPFGPWMIAARRPRCTIRASNDPTKTAPIPVSETGRFLEMVETRHQAAQSAMDTQMTVTEGSNPTEADPEWKRETDKLRADLNGLENRLEQSMDITEEPGVQQPTVQQPGVLGAPPGNQGSVSTKDGNGGKSPNNTPVIVIEEERVLGNLGGGAPQVSNFAYKLLCPKFDGEDFRGWLSKLEQYFEAENVPETAKIRVMMLHLEGKALQWHQFLLKTHRDFHQLNWNQYVTLLRERFAHGGLEDPFSELLALRQTESVEQFYEEFIHLLNQVQLPDEYVLSMFKNHLRLEISQYLQLLQPKTLMDAFHLAKHLEKAFFPAQKKTTWQTPKPYAPAPLNIPVRLNHGGVKTGYNVGSTVGSVTNSKNNSPRSLSPTTSKATGAHQQKGVGKMISPAEIEERRKKGLCFWCAAKYTPGHKCAKSQLFQIAVEGIEEDGEPEVFLDCEEEGELAGREGGKADSPILSLHAMWGASSWETMKIQVKIGEISCVALLDSGSSHNFLSWAIVKKTGLRMRQREQFRVMVSDGNTSSTMGECTDVTWEIQGHVFTTDFLVLPLKHCEKVLGVQWFSKLGAINWNFSELSLEFQWEGAEVKLMGDEEKRATPKQLEILLNQYEDVFMEPKGLPPVRGHDHRIRLIDEQAVVKAKPYRYLASQKDEIERLIKEMLESGVIRDSNSAFSSPIVMVKKKDDSWRMCVDYRRLNQLTIKDKFPMPIIEELLDELGKARVFSKLDLRSGYHQIRMSEPDIHKTAFRTHEGHYEFLVMPFGLTNAPATFQGLMNKVFKGLLRRSMLVFFDDILVYSDNWEQHLQHLKEV